jgi:ribosomal protein S18 acetylase RimI-like enzyme
VLAAAPDARGRGLGSGLLALAERIAEAEGISRITIVVSDANAGARRLYARFGYAEAARRPMAWDGPRIAGRNWVLLAKDLH